MPRHVTKTYGRQAASCSRVFDDVVRDSVKVTASQTSSTIRKWGETSFTSKRNAPASLESAPRKRKSEEIEEFDEESESIGDGIFSDPFSFDEEDDGPKKPKKAVKAKKEKKLPPKTYRILSTKNNKPEVSMFKNSAPSKTYTQVGKPTLPRAACAALPGRAAARKVDNQQMTMDSFTLKMTKKSSSMPAVSISGTLVSPVKLTAPPVEISSGNDTETEDLDARWERAIGSDSRKFFSSKDHDYSHSPVTISSEDDAVSSKKEHNYYQCSQEETKPESDWDSDSIFGSSQSVRKVKLVRRTVAVEEEEEKKVVAPVPSVPSGKDTSNGLKKMKKIELRDNESRSLSKKTEEPLVRRLLTSPKKKEQRVKASYNPRQWHGDDEPPAGNALSAPSSSNAANRIFDDFDETDPLPPVKLKTDPVMRRAKTDPGQRHYSYKDPSAKVTVSKESKPLFTVVKNVKQAHECLEHGETQEFQDDIEYILPGLKDSQPVPTRCLSTMSLATKCNVPAFRMHLRAHGVIMEILGILHDAAAHAPLALCVSALLFMNSRDRLVMDLERPALTLMLSLLSADSNRSFDSTDSEMEKMRLKVSTMLEAFRKEGNVKNFILEEISTGFLAMETLLSLTSKKAGDWFKEELRTLGGLDHIVNTVNASVEDFDEFSIDPSPSMLDRCRKLNRCLRVLENVTYLNSDNQTYLMTYKSAVLVKSLYKAIKSCENCLPFNEVGCVGDKLDEGCHGFVLYSCLLANLRVLLNLTHENMVGATRVGQMSGFIPTLLSTILRLPQFIPSNHRFDLLVLGLGLLINLVEECDHNQRMLLDATTDTPFEHSVKRKVDPLEAFALLFNLRLEAAKKFEVEHDRELDEKKKRKEEKRSYGSNQKMNVRKSGQWKESDSGLEWIVNPGDEEEAAEDGEEKEDREEEEERGLEDDPLVPSSQEEQEDLTKALHKAGKHMEDSIIAAYVSLLVGCLIQHNSHLAEKVRGSLPEESFDSMIRMLKKFLGFMNFTSATTGNTGSKSIMRVIGILDASNC